MSEGFFVMHLHLWMKYLRLTEVVSSSPPSGFQSNGERTLDMIYDMMRTLLYLLHFTWPLLHTAPLKTHNTVMRSHMLRRPQTQSLLT